MHRLQCCQLAAVPGAAVAGILPDLCWSSVAAVPPFHTTMDLHISHSDSSGPRSSSPSEVLKDVHGLPSASHLLHAGRSCRRPAAGRPACRPAVAPSRRRADEVVASPALEGGNDDQLIDEPMMPDWEFPICCHGRYWSPEDAVACCLRRALPRHPITPGMLLHRCYRHRKRSDPCALRTPAATAKAICLPDRAESVLSWPSMLVVLAI